MPILGTVNGSFFAGLRSTAYTASWDPSTSITTAFWLDASDTTSYTLSFNNVTAITDKSGNFSSINVQNTPQRVSGDLNSYNTILFDGTEDFTTATTEAVVSSGNHWAIGVFQWNTINNNKDTFYSFETDQSPKRDYAVSSSNASAFDGELDLDGLSSNRISSTIGNTQDFDSGIAQNTWTIIGTFFNKTGNQIGVRVNGANAFTPVNDYDNNLKDQQDVRIFRNRSSERMAGKMAEFFCVADVPGTGGTDISEFEKAEGYLAHKWGLTSNLPVSHPYKSSAP